MNALYNERVINLLILLISGMPRMSILKTYGRFKMRIKNSEGFTLVELLIVVAIIAILGAIAIPQFSAYRFRAFNASANSDARNLAATQEALFTDTQAYGEAASAILPATTGSAGPGPVLVSGPIDSATLSVAGGYIFNERGTAGFPVSNGVIIGVTGTTAVAPEINNTAYIITAKHAAGNACYGRDSDSTSSYKATYAVGKPLVPGDVATSVKGQDDLLGKTIGNCIDFTAQ
jgi:type IV pilus assembly protein PilA